MRSCEKAFSSFCSRILLVFLDMFVASFFFHPRGVCFILVDARVTVDARVCVRDDESALARRRPSLFLSLFFLGKMFSKFFSEGAKNEKMSGGLFVCAD